MNRQDRQEQFHSFHELAVSRGLPAEERKSSKTEFVPAGVYSSRDLFTEYINSRSSLGTIEFGIHKLEEAIVQIARETGDRLYVLLRDTGSAAATDLLDTVTDLIISVAPDSEISLDKQTNTVRLLVGESALPELPLPYGYKGGAARLALRAALGIGSSEGIRDLDLVRYGRAPREQDIAMAKQYMAEDYHYNKRHGVEVVHSVARYASTRDFTMSEVLYHDGAVTCSAICILDTLGGIIRPATRLGRMGSRRGSNLPPGIHAKALRFLAESTATGQDAEVHHVASEKLDPFSIALNLKRSLSHGPHTADLFIAAAEMTRALPKAYRNMDPTQLKAALAPNLKRGAAFFEPFIAPN